MRILLVADAESDYIWDHFNPDRFANIDLIISCGDLKSDYLGFIATMIHAPVYYVHGNHDTQYNENPPGGCDSIEDQLIIFKGLRIIGLGGSIRYNNRPLFSQPPFQCTEKEMEKRIKKLKRKIAANNGFDILVSHAPPHGIGDDVDLCHTGFKTFLTLLDEYKPSYMFHGHMHLKFGRGERIKKYNDTTIIDAYGYHILEI